MPKKLLDSKFLYIILSVIISISLWYYVTTVEGVTDTDTVNGLPVFFEGEDVLLERGLMITSEANSVNMKFQATASNLAKLKAEGAITLSLDVSVPRARYPRGYRAQDPCRPGEDGHRPR